MNQVTLGDDNAMQQPHPQHPLSPLAAFLSYLIPGLGQIYLGKIGKGLLFLCTLLPLFFLGQWMGNWKNVYLPLDPKPEQRNLAGSVYLRWHYAGQFWIGIAAWPAILQFYEKVGLDEKEYPFLSQYQRGPRTFHDELVLNQELTDAPYKIPDLGLIYTVIAGVLNILVIYDAFAGPAYSAAAARKPKEETSPPQETGAQREIRL